MDEDSSPSLRSNTMPRRWLRKLERYFCGCVTYLPLVFVYSITTWAVWVVVKLGGDAPKIDWIGTRTSIVGVALYALLNWSYTTAVLTDPGSTTNAYGYSTLPTNAPPPTTSFTVKSNGEMRFCKKCQARKPDRAHHCSTCRRCVLKMDHHCPWLATCVGLHNHKAFLLFLVYTTLFCFYCFFVSGYWVYTELSGQEQYVDTLMPINYIMLTVISGIIGLVLGAFTGWHIHLASKGQTTIECLEKTRYLSPLRKSMQQQFVAQHTGQGLPLPKYGQQLYDIHANALPGITRPEEGEARVSNDGTNDAPPVGLSYEELERYRANKRYEEYLDEQDSEKLPNAFDLGPKRNLLHLLGPTPYLWFLPICNTTGDGWSWEASPKWLAARERIARERADQRQREAAAGWGGEVPEFIPNTAYAPNDVGVTRHYLTSPKPPTASSGRKTPSKADRILGRDPNMYADEPPNSVPMQQLRPRSTNMDNDLELSSDEEEGAEQKALNLVTNGGWARSGASGLLRKPTKKATAYTRVETRDDDELD